MTARTSLGLIVSFFTLTSAGAEAGSLYEDFTTTTYKDEVSTTADWNTAAGELRLAPFAPTLVGTYDTPGSAFGVAVDGDIAFVADQLSGLQVIDISDPSQPSLLGSLDTSGSALGIARSGSRVFIADSASGLQIIDVSNPASPTLLGTYDTPGFATAVAVTREYAFVADYSGGLQIINISNPAIPTLAGSLGTPGNATGVAVDGDYVFLTDDSLGLRVIDVSAPGSPVSIGFIDTTGSALGVAVDGEYALVADGGNGLLVFDILDPTNPTLIGSYNSPGNARSIAVTGNRAFLADHSNGLQVVDITDPTSPTLIHGFVPPGQARSVVVDGSHAFVAGATSGLQVIETSQVLDTPQLVGTYISPSGPQAIAIAGNYAFLGSGFGTNGFEVVDISDPANPSVVGSYDTPHSGAEVVVAGDYAYVSDGTTVLVMDISDPINPSAVGSYDPASYSDGLVVDGDLALITMQTGGVELFDVSDPTSPTYIATYNSGGQATDVAISGDYAFVTRWLFGLHVVDISDPANPVLVGSVATPGEASGVVVAGNHAYVGDGNSGLQIVDISDPTNPVLAGNYDTPGYSGTVRVAGDYAFVAESSSGGLQVIDISNPDNPIFVGSHDTSSSAWDVAVAGNHAFLVGSSFDLLALQVFQEEVDTRNNVGQSIALDAADHAIVRARLTTTQTSGISWGLSNDGSGSLQPVTPGTWTELPAPGVNLKWRSTLDWSPGTDPVVSDVTVEWLNDFGPITSVEDVPDDEGNQVSVEWTRSGHDFPGDPSQIVEYALYRKIDPNLREASASMRSFDELSPAARENARMMQEAGWHFLLTVPVLVEDSYAVVVPTLADSTISDGDYRSIFRVTSLTATPGVFFHSPPDSGYSLDNLAPEIPVNLRFTQPTVLEWDEPLEADFAHHTVYGSTNILFDGAVVVGFTVTPTLDVTAESYDFYHVTTTDHAGNVGAPASIVDPAATSTPDGTPTPVVFAMRAARPNPFRAKTAIGFDLPVATSIEVRLHDASGRHITQLASGVRPAGRHTVTWSGTDGSGRRMAPGVYFVRIEAGGFTDSRRLVLLR